MSLAFLVLLARAGHVNASEFGPQVKYASHLLGIDIRSYQCRGDGLSSGCLINVQRGQSPRRLQVFLRREAAWIQVVVEGTRADQLAIAERVERELGLPIARVEHGDRSDRGSSLEWDFSGVYVLLPFGASDKPSVIAHVLISH